MSRRAQGLHDHPLRLAGALLFALAGVLHLAAPHFHGLPDVLMSLANSLVFVALALGWGVSLHHRLLPGRIRTYLVAAALLMALWMLLRCYKYRVEVMGDEAELLCWYGYYVCHMGIACMLFLTTLALFEQTGHTHEGTAAVAAVLAVALSVCMLTNNLHHGAFVPVDGFLREGEPYSYGPLYYVSVTYIYGLASASVLLLVRLRLLSPFARTSVVPLAMLAIWGINFYVEGWEPDDYPEHKSIVEVTGMYGMVDGYGNDAGRTLLCNAEDVKVVE